MKQFVRKYVSIILLLVAFGRLVHADTSACGSSSGECFEAKSDCSDCKKNNCDAQEKGTGIFLPRPQGLNAAVVGWNPFFYPCGDLPDTCFHFALGYRYRETRNKEEIAQCLFGTDPRGVLLVTGSKTTPNPASNNWTADYFGLRPDFIGQITFNPKIEDNIIDWTSYWELGTFADCMEGTYLQFNSSLVTSKWDLGACVKQSPPKTATDINNPGMFEFRDFPECYMATEGMRVEGNGVFNQATGDLKTAFSGDYLFGDMQAKWKHGRFWNGNGSLLDNHQTDTQLANIDVILGYDVLRCEDYHFGIFAKAVAPTGNRPDSTTVFQPIIGNGHHWEFGAGINAHWDLWCCDDQCIQAYLTGSATHLFDDTQWRTFDFKASKDAFNEQSGMSGGISGVGSRYVLLKEFDPQTKEYIGELINAVDFLTRRVKTRFNVQGEAAVRLLYRNCNWAFGIGYNFYGRSGEKICKTPECDEYASRKFGIKGINGVCRLEEEGPFTPKPLHSTSSGARMLNKTTPQNPVPAYAVDSPVDKLGVAWDSRSPVQDSEDGGGNPNPTFVTDDDIDFAGGAVQRQLTSKIFAHLDYLCEDVDLVCQPYFGIGGEAEFAHDSKCRVCTAGSWGVWLRGGINY